jgi:F-box and WD-40 domain protein CDC4
MESSGQASSLMHANASNSYSSANSSISSPRASDLLTDPFREDADGNCLPAQRNSDVVLGQLSFAPATQTIVITTTTTTTTNFPPLLMKAPQHLHSLDPKEYPLAASPTPASIRKFRFNIGGRSAIFEEAEDVDHTLNNLKRQHDRLEASNGMIRNVTSLKNSPQTPGSQTPLSTPLNESKSISHMAMDSRRPMTRIQRARSKESSFEHKDSKPNKSSKLNVLQTSTPFTPSLDIRNATDDLREQSSKSNPIITPETEPADFAQTLSPQPEGSPSNSGRDNTFASSIDSVSGLSTRDVLYRRMSTSRARPSALDTSAAQDVSLPSPSLSPVTAAATLQQKRGYFEEPVSNSPKKFPNQDTIMQASFEDVDSPGNQNSSPNKTTSLTDLPSMLDSFESMPTEMKTYFMYQLLRRCPKPVLHFVADNVNPALKCDFLTLLPPELAQNVISHLDLRSLCRASQVSKKWRKIIDCDEKVWKDLFDAEGFELSKQELKRAVHEGWGWQFDPEPTGYEENLGTIRSTTSSHASSPSTSATLVEDEIMVIDDTVSQRRSKRKAGTRARVVSRKQQKKKKTTSNEVALFDTESMTRHLASTDGPYAAAEAALLAVPTAAVGLPSLRNLHLHKSIYRRHHLIRKNWMQDEIKPKHLAFKAHQRHVVTCLQFDSERILTGSDDTNINVYDTQTGTLKAKLEGHEGGVWALQYVGSTLVSGSTDRSVRIWDIEKGVCSHVFLGHTSTVRCLIILMPTEIGKTSSGRPIMMPKEPIIITGSRDSTLRIWKLPKPGDEPFISTSAADDAESPYFIRALTGHGNSVRAIAAHGDTLVSGSYDHSVRVWSISTGETVHRLIGHSQKVYSVVLDHERNRCISGSMDNLVKVWSLKDGTLLCNLEGHTSLVGLLDLQRNRLISAAADTTLRIWDPDSGQCKNELRAHTGAITCFQHDGRKVISGSDRTLKMWNVQTGEFVRDLLTDLSGVWQVKFDERRCVAAVQREGLTYIEVTIPDIYLLIQGLTFSLGT